MLVRITRMKAGAGLIVVLCLIVTSVRCQSCIKCGSENEDEEDCGSVKSVEDSAELSVAGCTADLGCFTEIYESPNSERSGWLTIRDCMTEDKVCEPPNCLTCQTNMCNSEVFPMDRHSCLSCSNDDCSATKSEYCSIHLPGSQECVTLFDDCEIFGHVTLKGCLSDLFHSTRDLCNDPNYLDCKKCTGVDCNKDSQREGTKCHQCSGVDCLVIETKSNIVDCRSSCYIGSNANGEPVRGCSSDFSNLNVCSNNEDSTADCFVCDGDGCNNIIFPRTGRLQCHTCIDGDCEPSNDNTEYCAMYSSGERCASVFDSGSDEVIARGCVSTLATQQKETCDANSPNCLKCAYDKCNKDDSKSKTEFCIGCDSLDDPDCLKENLILEKRCSTRQCFTRLIEPSDSFFGRHMERGCLADLLASTTCNEPDCVSCTGQNCNNKLFPDNRISCKSCQGETCNGGSVDKICNQFVANEACFTFYGEENEVILRDCYADAPEGTRQVCDDPLNIECSKCQGSLCNIDNQRRGSKCFKCDGLECLKPALPDVVECLSDCYVGVNSRGEPLRGCSSEIASSSNCGISDMSCLTCNEDLCNGIIYPTQDRLTCMKCYGVACETLNDVSEFCERWSPDERCVTVFDSLGSVIERGCSSAIQNTAICSSSNPNCLSCNFDECNVETSPTERYHCLSCNSADDSRCVSDPLKVQVDGCRSNQCYTRLLMAGDVGQHIERGCGLDVPSCTGASCQTCEGERCNALNFPASRHSCYYCSGDHCALGHMQEKLCTLYNPRNADCITIYGDEGEVTYRDCWVDAAQGTRQVCSDTTDLTCSSCTGKLCNNDTKRRGTRCLKCDGIECFNSHDSSNMVDCLTGGCYVGLNANGETKRDCASDVTSSSNCARNDTQSNSCLICDDDLCNGITYPMDNRLVCKECLGESCEESFSEEKYCERLHPDEQCVTYFDGAGKVAERGCSSTVQHSSSCNGVDSHCLKCNFNRCNIHQALQEVHHCVSCNSKDDPGCVGSSASVTTKTCMTDQCYSRLVPSTPNSPWQYVEKGCVADLANPSACTGSNCLACVGDRCNDAPYPSDRISCFSCRNDECKASSIPTNYCGLYNREEQACITLFNKDSEPFYRGCYADAATGTQEVCDDSSQLLCTKCKTRNCNRDTTRRGKKCFKCQGLDCFVPNHPGDVVDCLSNCYMGVNEHGESSRDCSSAVANLTSCGANDDGVNRCSVCSDDLCNGIQFPLAKRLQCHVCTGEHCDADESNLAFCERYHDQERCVSVFSKDNEIVERGCSSSLYNSRYCDQNYANCIQCTGNGCNNITSKLDRQCVVCDSSTNTDCVLNPAAIAPTICKDGCFTRLVQGTLTRGCYEYLPADFDCSPENGCQTCNDFDKCNVENFPSDRKSCQTCVGAAACQNPTNRLCVKYSLNDSCITLFDGYHVERKGCLADQSAANQIACLSSSNPLCSSCSSRDNCNFETVRKDENCIVCSSALDVNCAQRPSVLQAEHCSLSSDGQCFARIKSGATVRGCLGQLSSTEATACRNNTVASQCVVSAGEASNVRIVPENRRRCFHCDSRVDATCSSKPTNMNATLPCRIFHQPENCLKLELKDGAVVRGCAADFSSDICDQGSCYKCSNEDGCNGGSLVSSNIFCIAILLLIAFAKSS